MTETEKLKEYLFNEKKCGWDTISEEKKFEIDKFSTEYMYFLNKCKTERECAEFIKQILEENGFTNLRDKLVLLPGDKVYYMNRNKTIYAAVIGEKPIEAGMNIVGSHIDSPRLDLKPNPLYEDMGLGYLKTHYYGGIKKYQ